MQNRSYVNVNLNQVKSNYKVYKSLIKPHQKIMAVVKANAYGHGDVEVATVLQELGCRDFAVSNLEEGVKLRCNGIAGTILILGYTPINRIFEVEKYSLTQAIFSMDYLTKILSLRLKIKVQFKIETGMNRLGLIPNKQTEKAIKNSLLKLQVEGLFTHLATADDSSMLALTNRQIKLFENFIKRFKKQNFPYLHYLNSAGGILVNNGVSTHVRLGIILYGLKPSSNFELPLGVKPCLEWKSVITMIKRVKVNEFIGYGASYKTNKNTLVATVSTGYADGFSRAMSNGGTVIVNGKKARVIGRVCMDQFMIDVTDIIGVKPYSEVTIIGNFQTANDLALYLNTIPYEVVCQISSRVFKNYLK